MLHCVTLCVTLCDTVCYTVTQYTHVVMYCVKCYSGVQVYNYVVNVLITHIQNMFSERSVYMCTTTKVVIHEVMYYVLC